METVSCSGRGPRAMRRQPGDLPVRRNTGSTTEGSERMEGWKKIVNTRERREIRPRLDRLVVSIPPDTGRDPVPAIEYPEKDGKTGGRYVW